MTLSPTEQDAFRTVIDALEARGETGLAMDLERWMEIESRPSPEPKENPYGLRGAHSPGR